MKKIVLYTSGTLGDHLPFIVLGKALADRGHRVVMAVNRAMVSYVEKVGLEAMVLTDKERGPEEARENAWAWDHWSNPFSPDDPRVPPFNFDSYITQVRELISLSADADLLVSTSIRNQGWLVHEAAGVPWLTVSLNPAAFADSRRAVYAAAAEETHRKAIDYFAEINNKALAALGLGKKIPSWRPGWLFARHVLLASSPLFSRPDLQQLQPHSSIDMTGFWYYEDPDWETWKPTEELGAFMERRPLVLAFSSQPLEDPGRMLNMHIRAARLVGLPLLVQEGWAGFSPEALTEPDGDDLMFAGFLPQDWLFARAAASLQHGGIGSIARALRQGCPLLVEPFGNDQGFNARQVERLGAGAARHPFKTSAESIARALEGEVLSEECRHRVEELAAGLREEEGIDEACRLIETYLGRVAGGQTVASGSAPSLGEPNVPPRTFSLVSSSRGSSEGGEGAVKIPRIIHQVLQGDYISGEQARCGETWRRYHKGWEYRLWREREVLEVLQRHFPWFLPLYREYGQDAMRAGAIRYFLLAHYGGLYADMDCECLRPFDDLLEGKRLVMGAVPKALLKAPSPEKASSSLVSDAVLASVPGHPFWDHVIQGLVATHHSPDAAAASGLLLLGHAWDTWEGEGGADLEPVELFAAGKAADETARARCPEGGEEGAGKPRQEVEVKASLLLRGTDVSSLSMKVDRVRETFLQSGSPPRVSCLMVTAGREQLARRAIHCFQLQTWPNRELIILDNGDKRGFGEWVGELRDERISYHYLRREGRTLGELRNISVDRASGEYLAVWDDDDLASPHRLELQVGAAHVLAADACFLERCTLWWPRVKRMAYSVRRVWEPSLLCAAAAMGRYPHMKRGEDTPVVEQLLAGKRVALLDAPALYVKIYHGGNTWEEDHGEEHWQVATESFRGASYDLELRSLRDCLQLDLSDGD